MKILAAAAFIVFGCNFLAMILSLLASLNDIGEPLSGRVFQTTVCIYLGCCGFGLLAVMFSMAMEVLS